MNKTEHVGTGPRLCGSRVMPRTGEAHVPHVSRGCRRSLSERLASIVWSSFCTGECKRCHDGRKKEKKSIANNQGLYCQSNFLRLQGCTLWRHTLFTLAYRVVGQL